MGGLLKEGARVMSVALRAAMRTRGTQRSGATRRLITNIKLFVYCLKVNETPLRLSFIYVDCTVLCTF